VYDAKDRSCLFVNIGLYKTFYASMQVSSMLQALTLEVNPGKQGCSLRRCFEVNSCELGVTA
jgi:hypothetical protein